MSQSTATILQGPWELDLVPQFATREAWMLAAIDHIKPLFKREGYSIPSVKVSIGFTSHGNRGKGAKTIGQAWDKSASLDNIAQIFIVPKLGDSVEILAVLVHELVHATVGNESKHGPTFKRCALAVGLEGKMTATVASRRLENELRSIVELIGDIPHAELNSDMSPVKKQGTRLIKLSCPSCEDYSVRASRKVIDLGLPACPCGETLEESN